MTEVPAQADFIICGGGSAGCVLANRLSENPSHRVVLLEAGPNREGRFFVNMPAGTYRLMADAEVNWLYQTEPDPSLGGRSSIWPAGRLLGGGSSINGMVYIRGSRDDYDGWAELGCAGWSWKDVLPYFKRSEDFQGSASASHAEGGPLSVASLRIKHPLADAFIAACAETGLRRVADYCDGDIDGAFVNYVTQRRGQRWSSARAHLGAAAKRSNLTVLTGAVVDRVLFEGRRARGVRYRLNGEIRELQAEHEIILSAGAIQSPAILMRSGIGPQQALRALGIAVLADAPDVGRNLQEHASFPSSRFVDIPTYNAMAGPHRLPLHIAKYLLFGRGILTTAPVHAMAFLRSSPDLEHPDIKLQFGPACFDVKTRTFHKRSGVTIFVNVAKPASRGAIRLRGADPDDRPIIDHPVLGAPEDMAAMVAGLKAVDSIYAAPSLASHVTGRNLPAEAPATDADWEAQLRSYTGVGFHLVASCRMGNDERSVVDPELRVRGVTGLRVIDASIMPVMPSANTNAPAMMVAEKGADLIRADAAVGTRDTIGRPYMVASGRA